MRRLRQRVVLLTEHMEHDWSRGGGPSGELSLALVHPSLGTDHVDEGEGGHRLCVQSLAIPQPSKGGIVPGSRATREVTTQVQCCALRHIQPWLSHHTYTCRPRTGRELGICRPVEAVPPPSDWAERYLPPRASQPPLMGAPPLTQTLTSKHWNLFFSPLATHLLPAAAP